MRALLLARSLEHGGAQRQLSLVARALADRSHRVRVAVLYGGGPFSGELRGSGVEVVDLGKSSRWDLVSPARSLLRAAREPPVDVLYSFEEVPNLLAASLRPWLADSALVWGVRSSGRRFSAYDWTLAAAFQATRLLSRVPDRIVANSEAGRQWVVSRGYPADRVAVVPNGVDTDRFRPDGEGGRRVRREWGIPPDAPLIGLVARLVFKKGHDVFLEAADRLAAELEDVRFACVGRGTEEQRRRLRGRAAGMGLGDRLVWDGSREDMSAVYSAFDVHVSASRFGEGTSNALAEAMACGTPCVATDVGDAARIVDAAGRIVPPESPTGLAEACRSLLALGRGERRELGRAARRRIVEAFGLERLVGRTEVVLEETVAARRGSRQPSAESDGGTRHGAGRERP